MNTLEAALETFLHEFESDSLTDADRDAARALLADQLGLQVGLSTLPWSEAAADAALRTAPDGNATIAGSGVRVDPQTAAYCNATFAHGFEYDDAHSASDGHPGSVVASTALALAEAEDRTIEEAVIALVAGYEVYTRLGAVLSPHALEHGWHPHALLAPFGAAATALALGDDDRETISNALAIAASHGSASTEYSSTGGSVKRVHAGIGARDGIQSVALARAGVTGPERYLGGNKGLLSVYADVDPPGGEAFSRNRLEIHDTWFKLHSCCGCTHAYLDCLAAIDPDPDDVERVTARLQPSSDRIVGTQNENLYAPRSIEEAQFNLPFALALALSGIGTDVRAYRSFVTGERDYDDPALRATMERIDLEVDPDMARYAPAFVGDLTVHYADGTTADAFVEHTRGTPDNPATESDRREKFDALAEPIIGAERTARLWDHAIDAPCETPVRSFRPLLEPPASDR
ncbi:MmgE/PrpD family protein [Halovivax gelatinilyticus]|uniref:MmgE/PrpD family protein n=1 Tax=Halovivax gelatinilyticus TaxID=2961597 RepID=UPI0020CA3122|nr:MmgE/PrpD family protein [Halovivax gelatinilyticus]